MTAHHRQAPLGAEALAHQHDGRIAEGAPQIVHVVGAGEDGVAGEVLVRIGGQASADRGRLGPGLRLDGGRPIQGRGNRPLQIGQGLAPGAEAALVDQDDVPGGPERQDHLGDAPDGQGGAVVQPAHIGAAGTTRQVKGRRAIGRPRGAEPGEPHPDRAAMRIGPVLGDEQGPQLIGDPLPIAGGEHPVLDDDRARPGRLGPRGPGRADQRQGGQRPLNKASPGHGRSPTSSVPSQGRDALPRAHDHQL